MDAGGASICAHSTCNNQPSSLKSSFALCGVPGGGGGPLPTTHSKAFRSWAPVIIHDPPSVADPKNRTSTTNC